MNEAEWLTCNDPQQLLEFLRGARSVQPELFFGCWVPVEKYRHERISLRKLRLFACACCRRIEHLYSPERIEQALLFAGVAAYAFHLTMPRLGTECCRQAVDLAENHADSAGDAALLAELRECLAVVSRLPINHRLAATRHSSDVEWEAFQTGLAANAVENACEGDFLWLMSVARRAALAIAARHYQRGEGEAQAPADTDEMAAQCLLLRDIVGNPFRPVAADHQWLTLTVVSLAQSIYEQRAFDRLPILADALEDAGCTSADLLCHCREPRAHVRGCWLVDRLLGKK